MKNILNTSELQRKGLKEVYEKIDEYGQFHIVNQRTKKILTLIDSSSPNLLINIIKDLKRIKSILKKEYNITKIGIFGSYARGENNNKSDLDLITDFEYDDIRELIKLEMFISKELKKKDVDLLTFQDISPFAIENMERDVIYV